MGDMLVSHIDILFFHLDLLIFCGDILVLRPDALKFMSDMVEIQIHLISGINIREEKMDSIDIFYSIACKLVLGKEKKTTKTQRARRLGS
jgi:hypothetical protein